MNLIGAKIPVGSRLTMLTRVVILIALYFLGGMLGKEASFLSESTALIWPPAGIALAAIILFGYRFWPGVALGAVLFSFTNGAPIGFFTMGTAIGNTLGAIVGAFLLERITNFDRALERTRDVVSYICFACILGTIVNAAFTVTGLAYAGEVSWDSPFSTALRWWVPNALAGLVVAPFIISWAMPSSVRWNPKLIMEAVVCGLGLVAGTLISFNSWFVYGIQNYPLAYLPFPFLVWGALRFGQRGATTGTLLVSSLAIHSLLGKGGPFFTNNETDSLMLIGSYIGVLAVTNMLLAAASTERKQAELAVSQSEKRFRAVVEDQTELICRFKPDGTITFVNGAFARFHQKENHLLLGTNWLQTLSKEDTDVAASYFSALPKEQPVVSFDQRVFTPDGKAIWQQHTVRRLFEEQGGTLEFQAVIQDITPRKEAEQRLLASENKYRSLLANIPDIVWAGTARGQLTYVSDNVEHILGYSPLELTSRGTLWLDRIHPNDRPAVEKAYKMLSSERASFHLEYRIQRKDAQWIWLHSRASATGMQNGVLYAEGLSSDITQRKIDEEALRCAKESSEAANRAKSQFLANMSHELRTPLNAIIGFSEILADKTFGELNPRQLKYSNNILGSGRHLLQLINDILDLSKVEAGRMELSTVLFPVSQTMQEVHSIVKTLANKKSIDLCFDIASSLPALQADQAKFKQIMYNLLSNAIKFTPEKGRIVVGAKLVDNFDSEKPAGAISRQKWLKVSVADNGIGIDLKNQERVFVEFEQVDSSHVRQENGTGLGLALTKKLVKLHGGKIWLESQGANQGSTFAFVLPMIQINAKGIDSTRKNAADSDRLSSPKALAIAKETA